MPSVGAKRLRDCQWPVAVRLRIPRDWISGIYLIRICFLTLRDQARPRFQGWRLRVARIQRNSPLGPAEAIEAGRLIGRDEFAEFMTAGDKCVCRDGGPDGDG
jgi:hypothetical protein